jgi:hypothetical protein
MKRRTLLASGAALLAAPAWGADANAPHPHQGILPKYSGAPPVPALTEADLATLAAGKPVLKQVKTDTGGRGTAVQDIQATPEAIWSKITSYANYPTWVDGVHECSVYKQVPGEIFVRFVIGAMGIKVEYFVRHLYRPDSGYMTWTLDYTRQSDLDDSVGFWRVEALADKPGWTRVYYSVQVKLSGWVPGFVEDMLANSGLTKATAWVKREAEKG